MKLFKDVKGAPRAMRGNKRETFVTKPLVQQQLSVLARKAAHQSKMMGSPLPQKTMRHSFMALS
jgi:hypothetical protein